MILNNKDWLRLKLNIITDDKIVIFHKIKAL